MMIQLMLTGRTPVFLLATVLAAPLLFTGCSSSGDTRKLDYESSTSLPPLEVPPDLTAIGTDESFAVPAAGGSRVSASQVGQDGVDVEAQSGVLPSFDAVSVERAGQMRWLKVQATPEQLWPKLRDFLKEQGLDIEREDPRIGVMETAWAENRAGITRSGLRKYLGKLYDAGTRDKYRLRVEREDEGVSAVYLTHRGARDVVADEDIVKWEMRPSDPELEVEMLRRLMVYLGRDAQAAKSALANADEQSAGVRLIQSEGRPALIVEDEFSRTWRRIGVALDRLSLVVEDQNRAGGTYYVTYKGDDRYEQGFFQGLFGGGDKDELSAGTAYQIQVLDHGSYVEVTAYDSEGAALSDDVAEVILSRLREELN